MFTKIYYRLIKVHYEFLSKQMIESCIPKGKCSFFIWIWTAIVNTCQENQLVPNASCLNWPQYTLPCANMTQREEKVYKDFKDSFSPFCSPQLIGLLTERSLDILNSVTVQQFYFCLILISCEIIVEIIKWLALS